MPSYRHTQIGTLLLGMWYGWSIRLTPHGWLYSVSGLAAVELTLQDGKRLRIGTDEPERLCQAIGQAQSGAQVLSSTDR
jgi:hypothetical protein